MALTADIKLLPIGNTRLLAAPLKGSATVYCGSIATLRSGYLVAATSPASTDVVVGMIGDPTGGTYVKTGPGITSGSVDGSVFVDCETGSFLIASGTGSDAITEANAGASCYVINESTVGLTSGSGTRPLAGTILPIDPTVPTGFVPVKLANPAS